MPGYRPRLAALRWARPPYGARFTDYGLVSADFGDSFTASAAQIAIMAYPDVNGEGKADVCGRSNAGATCALSNGTGFGPAATWISGHFGSAWNPDHYGSTIKFADVNGDGKDDICGRSAGGPFCALSKGTAFVSPSAWVTQSAHGDVFDYHTSPSYYRTIVYPDLDSDGKADLCGRFATGVTCGISSGSLFVRQGLFPHIANSGGFAVSGTYETLQYADLDGDGRAELICRAANGLVTAAGSAAAPLFTSYTVGLDTAILANAAGGSNPSRWRTLKATDVDGDGKAEICVRLPSGIACRDGDATAYTTLAAGFSDEAGWSDAGEAYKTIRYGDVNGDGKVDVCGRSPAYGVYCSVSS